MRAADVRIDIDRDRCIGAGQCQMTAPDVFTGDDDGFGVLTADHLEHAADPAVRDAARACPVQAITFPPEKGATTP